MEFLGVGPLEFLFIIVIALIVIGPRDMARTARLAGRYLNRIYRSDTWRTVTRASRTLRTLPERLAREAALEELDETRRLVEEASAEARARAQDLSNGMRSWTQAGQADPSRAAPADAPQESGEEPPEGT